jgi:hypothetical protein
MGTNQKISRDVRKILEIVIQQAEKMAEDQGVDLDSAFSMKKPKKEEKNA